MGSTVPSNREIWRWFCRCLSVGLSICIGTMDLSYYLPWLWTLRMSPVWRALGALYRVPHVPHPFSLKSRTGVALHWKFPLPLRIEAGTDSCMCPRWTLLKHQQRESRSSPSKMITKYKRYYNMGSSNFLYSFLLVGGYGLEFSPLTSCPFCGGGPSVGTS